MILFFIMINGLPSSSLTPNNGLWQGNLLSPCLCILCSEVFSTMLSRVMVSSSLQGLRISHGAPIIYHILFFCRR